jgi:hypothetical protein
MMALSWRLRRLQYLRETGRYSDKPTDFSGLLEQAARLVTDEQAEKEASTAPARMPDVQLDRVSLDRAK